MSTWNRNIAAVIVASFCLAGCGSDDTSKTPSSGDQAKKDSAPDWGNQPKEGLLTDLFTSKKPDGPAAGVGVNTFLWRASLDTIAFMPLASADPFGGVIITDWYSPPESPKERFKMSLFIMDRALHADGIRVSVFRQSQGNGGEWSDQPVNPKTAIELEDAILTRAREMRRSATAQK